MADEPNAQLPQKAKLNRGPPGGDPNRKPAEKKPKKPNNNSGKGSGSAKLRGLPNDSEEVRISKTLSWMLRHGAKSEGLAIRPDGYVKVTELVGNAKLKSLDLNALQAIVKADGKKRYDLVLQEDNEWWIRANQGHSMKAVAELETVPILSVVDIPSGKAVHGTTKKAWESIAKQGLSKMTRNHIHLAQDVVANGGVISGMRNSSSVLIYINVAKAIAAGLKFELSTNGVVLTEGDENGFLKPAFFETVVDRKGEPLDGWGGASDDSTSVNTDSGTQRKAAAETSTVET